MEPSLAQTAGWIPLAWAAVVASVSLEALRRARAAARRAPVIPPLPSETRVLLVRPCAGHEPHLERTLRSLAGARTRGTLRCVVAVETQEDTATPAARAAITALEQAGLKARLAFTRPASDGARALDPNRKAAQLAAVVATEAQPFDLLLVADSDVDLDGLDLDLLLAPLTAPRPASATWAPPAERAPAHTLGDRASAAVLGGSLHAFPLLAHLDPSALVGKLCAVRADHLARAGGFGALVAHLGEDMELARRLRAHGGHVAPAPLVASSLAAGRSLPAVVSRYARWLSVIRAQRTLLLASYPALFCATPLITALALATAPLTPLLASAALTLALGARLLTALGAARAAGRPTALRTALADALLADLVLLAAFTRALASRKVRWRDTVLEVNRRGLLQEAGA
ncbi:glycosyltransferase [Chondromyces crocatus]|uniref:Ceramide glucosyltransferase n=1 Tax=Chondromyces crocatus TaxID=52 RepID=A0A0K1E8X3_CHOCO|nr:glycosyltransferase [Chondromyces crocatus]AKT37315.1 uncharacterized protein CMC5_014470 [Chondromyces crocatus]